MWDKIADKLITLIAYLLLPITLPIQYYQHRQIDKKLERERKELEHIRQKNKLRR
jgi:regulatory protein YycI of two-component signal transduction system YycFG